MLSKVEAKDKMFETDNLTKLNRSIVNKDKKEIENHKIESRM